MNETWMSVVVPAYNEEDVIAGTVSAVTRWLEDAGRPYEVIVVDNASEDSTIERLEPLVDGERVQVLRNEVNRGKGYSVRRGMLDASGALRLMCDADCAASLASQQHMVELMDTADVGSGSRVAAGASVSRQQPFRRHIVGWPFIALTRMLLREPTKDVYGGFKLWRAASVSVVFSRLCLEGWTFDAEALALSRRLGYRVRETGIVWTDRDDSRLSMLRVLVPVIRELLQARRNVRGVSTIDRVTDSVANR
jgi:dolichyl-phosphate beta-glucosyltransferase